MKQIKNILFEIIGSMCALHLLILCLIFISQSCNKKTIRTETKEAIYSSKFVRDSTTGDTTIYSNKITREYVYHDKYIETKITVQPDTIKQYFEKTIKEKKIEEPWYYDFWKVITVLALFSITSISLVKLLK
jgi:hypothetical protein